MPMQGGKPSKLSRELGYIKEQLKTGKTRGNNPRDLDPDEIAALEQRAAAIKAEMQKMAKERLVNRINPHTTAEASRVISEVGAKIENATAASARYFEDVGGEGSVEDLRARAASLNKRATEKAKEERKQKLEEENAIAKRDQQRVADNRKAGRTCGICSKVEAEMTAFMGSWLCSVCEGGSLERERERERGDRERGERARHVKFSHGVLGWLAKARKRG